MLKVLMEIVQHCVGNVTLSITQSGIDVLAIDDDKNIMINARLDANKFLIYGLTTDHINISIDTSHFHRILKTLKKKDTLKLTIDDEDPDNTKMKIFVKPKECGRTKTSQIPFTYIEPENVINVFPTDTPTVIFADQFHKICKDLNNTTFNTRLKIRPFGISIETDSIYQTMETVSVFDEDDIRDDIEYFGGSEAKQHKIIHECTVNSTFLVKFMKLSRLSTKLHLHYVNNCIIISMPISGIGSFQATIKTNEMIQMETEIV